MMEGYAGGPAEDAAGAAAAAAATAGADEAEVGGKAEAPGTTPLPPAVASSHWPRPSPPLWEAAGAAEVGAPRPRPLPVVAAAPVAPPAVAMPAPAMASAFMGAEPPPPTWDSSNCSVAVISAARCCWRCTNPAWRLYSAASSKVGTCAGGTSEKLSAMAAGDTATGTAKAGKRRFRPAAGGAAAAAAAAASDDTVEPQRSSKSRSTRSPGRAPAPAEVRDVADRGSDAGGDVVGFTRSDSLSRGSPS